MAKAQQRQPNNRQIRHANGNIRMLTMPAGFIQSLLYKADGYHYYSASCCVEPHWGVTVSRTQMNVMACPANPDEHLINRTQVITYPAPTGCQLPQGKWSLSGNGTMVPDPGIGAYIPGPDGGFLKHPVDLGNVVFYDPTSGINLFPSSTSPAGKMFYMRQFDHVVAHTCSGGAVINFQYTFAVASKCVDASGAYSEVPMENVIWSNNPATSYPIAAGTIEWPNPTNNNVPVLITARR